MVIFVLLFASGGVFPPVVDGLPIVLDCTTSAAANASTIFISTAGNYSYHCSDASLHYRMDIVVVAPHGGNASNSIALEMWAPFGHMLIATSNATDSNTALLLNSSSVMVILSAAMSIANDSVVNKSLVTIDGNTTSADFSVAFVVNASLQLHNFSVLSFLNVSSWPSGRFPFYIVCMEVPRFFVAPYPPPPSTGGLHVTVGGPLQVPPPRWASKCRCSDVSLLCAVCANK